MRYSPVKNHVCQYCGKCVPLFEDDFFATISPSGKVNYFFECPNCEEVDKINEAFLPGDLRDKLAVKAKQQERDNTIYLYIFAILVIVAILAYFL